MLCVCVFVCDPLMLCVCVLCSCMRLSNVCLQIKLVGLTVDGVP